METEVSLEALCETEVKFRDSGKVTCLVVHRGTAATRLDDDHRNTLGVSAPRPPAGTDTADDAVGLATPSTPLPLWQLDSLANVEAHRTTSTSMVAKMTSRSFSAENGTPTP